MTPQHPAPLSSLPDDPRTSRLARRDAWQQVATGGEVPRLRNHAPAQLRTAAGAQVRRCTSGQARISVHAYLRSCAAAQLRNSNPPGYPRIGGISGVRP